MLNVPSGPVNPSDPVSVLYLKTKLLERRPPSFGGNVIALISFSILHKRKHPQNKWGSHKPGIIRSNEKD